MFFRPLVLLTILTSALFSAAQINLDNVPGASSSQFPSSISGRVQDTSNHGIDGARISVVNLQSGQEVATAYTFGNGGFQINNIPEGQYEVVATSGIVEGRTRVDLNSDRELIVRLPVDNSDTAGRSNSPTVSLTQMKVPGKARRLLQKAEDAFHKARLEDAFGLVQKALGVYPDYAQALTLRGILSMQKGDPKSAEPDLQKAIQLDYGDDMSYSALACLYNNKGEYDRALKILDHGIALNPKSWQGYLEMARANIGKQDFGAAIRSLDRAESFAPPSTGLPHLFRAQALLGMNDVAGAVKQLETYLTVEPNGPSAEMARQRLAQLKAFTAAAVR
jgi:tetratricopeptide (TPR) repeat protein